MLESESTGTIIRCSWEEFRASGLAWWINRILHTFGWALVFEIDQAQVDLPVSEQRVIRCYPARCRFRGFDEKTEAEGFRMLTAHIEDTLPMLKADLEGTESSDEIKKTLDEALRPFLFSLNTEESIQQAKDAMVEAFFGVTGQTPSIEVDTSGAWKNEIRFEVTWPGGGPLQITTGPGDL